MSHNIIIPKDVESLLEFHASKVYKDNSKLYFLPFWFEKPKNDVWKIHNLDNLPNEFELSQLKEKLEHFEKALKTIRDAFYTDGETNKEKVDDLKAIAFNALYEVEHGL